MHALWKSKPMLFNHYYKYVYRGNLAKLWWASSKNTKGKQAKGKKNTIKKNEQTN